MTPPSLPVVAVPPLNGAGCCLPLFLPSATLLVDYGSPAKQKNQGGNKANKYTTGDKNV